MKDPNDTKVLGDITPEPKRAGSSGRPGALADEEDENVDRSAPDASTRDRAKHSGSRDVTESTTTGTEVGGTRNLRTGSGATGTDIGGRPE